VTRIAVCVCTFRNPTGLADLLDGLDRQQLQEIEDTDVSIVVVDNDPNSSAVEVLSKYASQGRFGLFVKNQPIRGLSSARNTALDAAEVRSADVFSFLDDDEVPSSKWLQCLMEVFQDSTVTIAVGPVAPRFLSQPPEWVISGKFFEKRCPASTEIHHGYTSNVMMRTDVLQQTGVRFNEALNSIGGEDVVFFSELRRRGFHVRCVPEAVVSETIPPGRATLSWMMRRWVRAGATSAILENGSSAGLGVRMVTAARGTMRILGGGVKVILNVATTGRRDFSAVARSIATFCRGVGMFMSAFGHVHQEYGSSYRSETKQ
jgi:succinoglycan biosynthesis protein ExoM